MTMKKSTSQILKDNTMLIVLVLVYLFFTIRTGGAMFSPFNFNELITQNAYVFILASGMLMCMLTGGNIDLACGSLVCFLGAIGAYFMAVRMMPVPVAILLMLLIGTPLIGLIIGFVGGIAIFVFWIMGLINAIKEEEKPLPIIGGIHLIDKE